MIEWLRSNGAPVHCIGAQSHLGPQDIVPGEPVLVCVLLATSLGGHVTRHHIANMERFQSAMQFRAHHDCNNV